MPGPTGESNRLSLHPRGRVLCLGAGAEAVLAQAVQALAAGNAVLAVAAERALGAGGARGAAGRRRRRAGGAREPRGAARARARRRRGAGGLAAGAPPRARRRGGPIVPLVTGLVEAERYCLERHLCIDTTAAGGNASLLAATA